MTVTPFAQEGYDLMGAAFEVHREIGGGLLEDIYQECFEIELIIRNTQFIPRHQLQCFYKGKKLRKKYVPDLIVNASLVVALKAVSQSTNDHEAQLLNYMRLCRKPVGYLINFAPIERVEWKRFVIGEFI